ncbi:hypothetical protein ES703_69323 [subsurface metagenome]
MNLSSTVKINKKIMALIASKYPDSFPPSYHTVDFQYYEHLKKDVDQAERTLSYAKSK